MSEPLFREGDIVTIGDDPQTYRVDVTTEQDGIRAARLVPIPEDRCERVALPEMPTDWAPQQWTEPADA